MSHDDNLPKSPDNTEPRKAAESEVALKWRELIIPTTLIVILLALLLVATVIAVLNMTGAVRFAWLPRSSAVIVTILVPVMAAMVPLLQWHFTLMERRHRSHLVPTDSTEPSASAKAVSATTTKPTPSAVLARQDWGEAPDVKDFHGRQPELKLLDQWLLRERCRVVAIIGLGGMGKTALAATAVRAVRRGFDRIFWRSLQNALPLPHLIGQILALEPDHSGARLLGSIDDQISLAIDYLQTNRCMLILDNFDTILQGGQDTGAYRNGYESYGRLLQRMGETGHQSCLLVTSREKPIELARLEGDSLPVRSITLAGLNEEDGEAILREKGLFAPHAAWEKMVQLYSGNPLALKLVAQTIRDVFVSDVAQFLRTGPVLVGNVHELIDQQFQRLSDLEQSIMFWIAIDRRAVGVDDLFVGFTGQVSRRALVEDLASLRRRSMIETTAGPGFTLQPVILEYVTDRLVENAVDDIRSARLDTLQRYPLLTAMAKDYVRESQQRIIVGPILDKLRLNFGAKASEGMLRDMVSSLRQSGAQAAGYGAGNVLNLLIRAHCDLRGYDFSDLTVWQADLREVPLQDVSFARADLARCVFTDTFGGVLSLAFSPVDMLLAAGTARGEIRLWDGLTGTPMRTLRGHLNSIWCVAFGPNGILLASAGQDQLVRLWDLNDGHCELVLQGHSSRVRSVAVSPSGDLVASCGAEDQSIRLWDLSSGQAIRTIHNSSRVWTIAFNPDGTLLASGGQDSVVRLWDITTGQCIGMLSENEDWVWTVAFSPDGRLLACGCEDYSIRLWDIDRSACVQSLHGHSERIRSVSFSPDGTLIASGSHDETVRLWEVDTGVCRKILRDQGNRVWSVAFSYDGSILACGGEDQAIRLWDVSSGECARTLQGRVDRIYAVKFSPSDTLLASCGEGEDVRLWDTDTGRCVKKLRGHSKWVWCLDFSQSGRFLASGGHDRSVKLWQTDTGECIRTLYGHYGHVRSVAFAPDGQLLASGSEDQTIRLWRVATGDCLMTLRGHTNWSRSVSFSPSGKLLASGGEDQSIRFWEVDTGQCVKTIDVGCRVYSISFSPDGSLLASGGEDLAVKIWTVASGQCLAVLHGHTGGVRSVCFSPTGSFVASGGEDQEVRIWRIADGKCLQVLENQSGWIRSVAFNADGRLLAVGNEEGILKLWEVFAGTEPRMLTGERLYEGMIITGAKGLTTAQRGALIALGAVDEGLET